MARKKTTYKPRNFESGVVKDIFVSIYGSMLESPAFKDLKPRAQILLIFMRYHLYASPKAHLKTPQLKYKNEDLFQDQKFFFFSRFFWHDKYELYTNGNYFYQDKADLISHGFVTEASNGKSQRVQTVYCMSDNWKTWEKKN